MEKHLCESNMFFMNYAQSIAINLFSCEIFRIIIHRQKYRRCSSHLIYNLIIQIYTINILLVEFFSEIIQKLQQDSILLAI